MLEDKKYEDVLFFIKNIMLELSFSTHDIEHILKEKKQYFNCLRGKRKKTFINKRIKSYKKI